VIHRVDVHLSLLEGAQETGQVEFLTSTRMERVEQTTAASRSLTSTARRTTAWR
jgi:2-polyprenyl-6-methoxyphenol hydroxylase-like FAD-dependent oxidoreductase